MGSLGKVGPALPPDPDIPPSDPYTLMTYDEFTGVAAQLHGKQPTEVTEDIAWTTVDNSGGTTTDDVRVDEGQAFVRQVGGAGVSGFGLLVHSEKIAKAEGVINLTPPSATVFRAGGVIFAATGDTAAARGTTSWVEVYLETTAFPGGKLNLRIDGAYPVELTNIGISDGVPFDLRIELVEGRTQVYVDDVQLIDYEAIPTDDARRTKGGLLLVSENDGDINTPRLLYTKFHKEAV